MQIDNLPDWVLILAYEAWSEDAYRSGFEYPDAIRVGQFRDWLRRKVAATGLEQTTGVDYEHEMLTEFKRQGEAENG